MSRIDLATALTEPVALADLPVEKAQIIFVVNHGRKDNRLSVGV
jgi:hypothetical protein